MASYTYTVGVDFTSLVGTNVDISDLQAQIALSLATVQYIIRTGNDVAVYFSGALSGPEETTLDGIINAYTYVDTGDVPVTDTSTSTFSNKSLETDSVFFVDPADATKRVGFEASGAGGSTTMTLISEASTDRSITFPDADDTVAVLGAAQTLTQKTLANVHISGTGSTTTTSATLYSAPSATAITGSTDYYFNYFSAPATTPTTFSGAAATVSIEGPPSDTTGGAGYALAVDGGDVLIGAGTIIIPTGATDGYILTTDENGVASWSAPTASSTTHPDGTSSLPGITYTDELSTGFYRPANGQLGLSLTGTSYATWTSSLATYQMPIKVNSTSNQLVLGTTNTTTINATSPAASRTYTLPDAGGAASIILSTSSAGQTIAAGLTSSGTLSATKAGSSTAASAALYSSPASTAITGANDYYFNYCAAPSTSGSTTGTASTLFIAGAPSGTITNPYALNVAAGKTLIGGSLQITSGATNKYVLKSDASGNATWGLPYTPYYESLVNGSYQTTSSSLVLITNMTLTPTIAGTYQFTFMSVFQSSTNNRTITFDFAKNGTTIANTAMAVIVASGGATSSTPPVGLSVVVACNGTDTITVRAGISGGQLTLPNYRRVSAVYLDA